MGFSESIGMAFFSVIFTFLASTATAVILCQMKQIPFQMLPTTLVCWNKPEKKDTAPSFSLLVGGNTVCLAYLWNTGSFLSTASSISAGGGSGGSFAIVYMAPLRLLLYLVWIEGTFYAVHRVLHLPPFYGWIHKKHHENYHLCPIHAFYLSPIETGLVVLNQNLPFFFISFTFPEYLFIQYLYFLVEYLSHSDVFFEHHVFHHKYYKWNYCICFPLFDWIFGTYKEFPKIRS
jgi:sterol desaturase/sphingolipid hydroxylase (fatty acid hydroxylase superfamily)